MGLGSNYFGTRSLATLSTAEWDMQRFAQECVRYYNCSVLWGRRNEAEQDEIFSNGWSKVLWPNSDHNVPDDKPSPAIDMYPYIPGIGIPWDDIEELCKFREYGEKVAASMGVKLKPIIVFDDGTKDWGHWCGYI